MTILNIPVYGFGPVMDFLLSGPKMDQKIILNLSKLKSFWIRNLFLVDSFIDKV